MRRCSRRRMPSSQAQPAAQVRGLSLLPRGDVLVQWPLEVLLSGWKTELCGRGVEYLLELLRGLIQQRLRVSAGTGQNCLHYRVERGVPLLRLSAWFGPQSIRRVDVRPVVLARNSRILDVQR